MSWPMLSNAAPAPERLKVKPDQAAPVSLVIISVVILIEWRCSSAGAKEIEAGVELVKAGIFRGQVGSRPW